MTIGDLAGNHIDTIYDDINRYSLYAFIAAVVVVAALVVWRVSRRRRAAGLRPDQPRLKPSGAWPGGGHTPGGSTGARGRSGAVARRSS